MTLNTGDYVLLKPINRVYIAAQIVYMDHKVIEIRFFNSYKKPQYLLIPPRDIDIYVVKRLEEPKK